MKQPKTAARPCGAEEETLFHDREDLDKAQGREVTFSVRWAPSNTHKLFSGGRMFNEELRQSEKSEEAEEAERVEDDEVLEDTA